MEPDIWMRQIDGNEDHHYKYVTVYVDDLLIASKSPQNVAHLLINKYDFELKCAGPMKYYLGCDFTRNELGTLCFTLRKYIEKTRDACYSYFRSKPSASYSSPLEQGDHPKPDNVTFLD